MKKKINLERLNLDESQVISQKHLAKLYCGVLVSKGSTLTGLTTVVEGPLTGYTDSTDTDAA